MQRKLSEKGQELGQETGSWPHARNPKQSLACEFTITEHLCNFMYIERGQENLSLPRVQKQTNKRKTNKQRKKRSHNDARVLTQDPYRVNQVSNSSQSSSVLLRLKMDFQAPVYT